MKATRSNVQDLEAAIIQLKAKAVRDKFEDTFVNGDTATDAKAFDGVDKLTVAGQAVSMGTNGATLTLDKLDEIIDKVKGGKPHLLLMSRRSRRKLGALSRATGSGLLETDRNQFGMMAQFYDGIPIGVNDYISDAKTVGTSTDCSTLYAVQLGEGGLVGLTSPGGLVVERVGSLETKDASRTRVKWYVSLALFSSIKVSKLTGVRE
ncbi:MAG: phage major capsid protein [Chloroflexi bacterium]|nr:phage major capsid protein [Chloroflexota bacterium]